MVLKKQELHVQQYYDVVNIIREHPDDFPAWHSSPVAELYTPPVFKNQKKNLPPIGYRRKIDNIEDGLVKSDWS